MKPALPRGDEEFFSDADDDTPAGDFVFKAGHNPKKTGSVTSKPSKELTTMDLLHNEMQNALFDKLVKEHGADFVGTENSTGASTSIDVVVQTAEYCYFYEIQTAVSVKACIRQALPQLLEYAYWGTKKDIADKLIVVGQKKITKQAQAYLEFLRDTFKLPLHYEDHSVRRKKAANKKR